ncbi:MAG: PilT/PilU family type 4a pilus ATPase [Zoogloeaceae bacterium]|jgi:twitching motility protein PilT|nr:PilT/PilU family type 4a pilus ATPase [Zoogloeaceae bacterium]
MISPTASTAFSPWEACQALLDALPGADASDLHLATGRPAHWRRHGELEACDEHIWRMEDMTAVATQLLDPLRRQNLEQFGSADLGYSSAGGYRFRVNLFRSLGRLSLVARHLPERFAALSELHLPASIRELAYLASGLVLITGITGSGKSTTLATLIHEINTNIAAHILTIEDPVEFVHTPVKSLISHRELGTDTPDFALAVRAAMREDPDVILVGELRDTETMRAALAAAETGHLVFSTLHTADAVGATERFIGAFPGEEQDLARHRLSLVLKAVVAQQLLPRIDMKGRAPAVEILRGTPAVMNLIATGRTSQLYSTIESGMELGMQTYDQSLAQLARERLVSLDLVRTLARHADSFDWLVKNGGQNPPGAAPGNIPGSATRGRA